MTDQRRALIGATGYVGSTLLKQTTFDATFRSTTIDSVVGREFELVVCAAAPAKKWIANREPEADLRNIEGLMERLQRMRCGTFVLISTIDVFPNPIGVDEQSVVESAGSAYGSHRRMLETFVEETFRRRLIVRLPGLVGPGLRKNAIYDLLNDNNLQAIDARAVFQFYPMVNLWVDLEAALAAQLDLVHLTAEPISIADVASYGFGRHFANALNTSPVSYDMQSLHAAVFGGSGRYMYTRRETLQAVRAYAQSEPRA
jgi:nucleoside-diphosphate-sugar epimerase